MLHLEVLKEYMLVCVSTYTIHIYVYICLYLNLFKKMCFCSTGFISNKVTEFSDGLTTSKLPSPAYSRTREAPVALTTLLIPEHPNSAVERE